MPIVLKSVSLNLLEHSGYVQACNGTGLPMSVHTCFVQSLSLFTLRVFTVHITTGSCRIVWWSFKDELKKSGRELCSTNCGKT